MHLSQDEQETHLNLVASDRKIWHVFSDDLVMQRKLERIGAILVREMSDGIGKEYTLRANQVTLRKVREPMAEGQRAKLAERLRSLRHAPS